MRRLLLVLLAASCLLAISTGAWAHHSFAAEFDGAKPISLTGAVAEIRFENPHTWFYIDVTDEKGQVVRWGFEAGTPVSLFRNGVKPGFVKVGEKITINGFRARDMSRNYGAAHDFVLADGRKIQVGPSDGSGYGEKATLKGTR